MASCNPILSCYLDNRPFFCQEREDESRIKSFVDIINKLVLFVHFLSIRGLRGEIGEKEIRETHLSRGKPGYST